MRRAAPLLLALTLAIAGTAWSKKPKEPPPADPPAAPAPAPAVAPAATPAGPAKPESVVKYRQAVMKGMGSNLKEIGLIVKGEVPRPQDLVPHATAMHDAAIMLPDLWTADTAPDKQKTDAKPEIWTDSAKFSAAITAYSDATAKLLELAKAGDQAGVAAQYDAIGKTCGDCHDAFRVDD
jgi:cytochrome c556